MPLYFLDTVKSLLVSRQFSSLRREISDLRYSVCFSAVIPSVSSTISTLFSSLTTSCDIHLLKTPTFLRSEISFSSCSIFWSLLHQTGVPLDEILGVEVGQGESADICVSFFEFLFGDS